MPRDEVEADSQSPLQVMDFPSLNLGHPSCSQRTVDLGDMEVYVYGLDEIAHSGKDIAAIVRTPGQLSGADDRSWDTAGRTKRRR